MISVQGLGRGETVARVVTLPSRARFRTRGVGPTAGGMGSNPQLPDSGSGRHPPADLTELTRCCHRRIAMAASITGVVIESFLHCKYKASLKLCGEVGHPSAFDVFERERRARALVRFG